MISVTFGLSEEIIRREACLDESEWTNFKNIRDRVPRFRWLGDFAHLADIILDHLELWDGQGFPAGVKEDEIPLMSPIISIIHAF